MKYFIFWFSFFVELLPSPISRDEFLALRIWNVGQGQWSTLRTNQECLHFDSGGERAPLRKIFSFCANRKNILLLSHDDFDHIRYANWVAQKLQACWFLKEENKKFFLRLKTEAQLCPVPAPWIENIYAPDHVMKNANLQSFVFSAHHILFPGDAPIESEKLWLHRRELIPTKYLMLGHHGSKTSTGSELLKSMPSLRLAIASARHSRYGHPHAEVLVRLRQKKIPVLTTEDWGTIEIQL